MRLYYPGRSVTPALLVVTGCVALLAQLDLIHVARVMPFWPVTLIASGIEELYFWSVRS